MGRYKFTSLRKTYSILESGNSIPVHSYTYRVDAMKIQTCMSFLQECILLKYVVTRDITLEGFNFNNITVYIGGDKTLNSLFDAYKTLFSNGQHIGKPTFRDVVHLLTKCGEIKAGLSTYYIQFCYSSTIFIKMLQHIIKQIDFIQGTEDINFKAKHLVKVWNEIEQFLQWEYTRRHMMMESPERIHSCQHALGDRLFVNDEVVICEKCLLCFTLFSTHVHKFFGCVIHNVTPNDKVEVESMIRCLPYLSDGVVRYAGHRVRAKVQFNAISATKKSMLVDDSILLIVFYHKQTILPMKYWEGQVEYFRKKE